MKIRKVVIPVAAGRNLAVLVETAVRNFVLNRGIDSTREFIERQAKLDGGGAEAALPGVSVQIILVLGVSGAGKMSLGALEDVGFAIVSNLPVALLVDTVDAMLATIPQSLAGQRSTRIPPVLWRTSITGLPASACICIPAAAACCSH